jgi:hypothetical protein
MKTDITLGHVAEHLEMLEIGCRKCDLYDRLSVARLIEEYGADQAMPELLRSLAADCPRQPALLVYARCGAYWKFMRHERALRMVLLIIVLAALALSLVALGLFSLPTPPIWVMTPDASAPRVSVSDQPLPLDRRD